MTKEARIIAVLNQKGGVGKTTVTCTLAHMIALQTMDVLVVDLDPQGNVADLFGLTSGSETSSMLRGYSWETVSLGNAERWGTRNYISVLRANEMLSSTKQQLVSEPFREMRIYRELQRVAHDYDYILLDLAPSLDWLHLAAMVAADWFLVVTKLDRLATSGAEAAVRTACQLYNSPLNIEPPRLLGVLPNFWDRRTTLSSKYLTQLAEAFGKYLLPPIPVDTDIIRASIAGEPITEFRSGARSVVGIYLPHASHPTGGYQQLFTRVYDRMNGTKTTEDEWNWSHC